MSASVALWVWMMAAMMLPGALGILIMLAPSSVPGLTPQM